HGARVVVGPHRLEPERGRFPDEGLRHQVERVLPRDALEAPGALGADAAERMEQPIRVVHPLRVAPDLLADHAAGVRVAMGAPDAADRAGVDALHLEGAGAGAVVRAHRGHDFHDLEDTPGFPSATLPPWPRSARRPRTKSRWSGFARRTRRRAPSRARSRTPRRPRSPKRGSYTRPGWP